MAVITEAFTSNVDIARRQKLVADLGDVVTYFTIAPTQEDVRMQKALNDLAWADLAESAYE